MMQGVYSILVPSLLDLFQSIENMGVAWGRG